MIDVRIQMGVKERTRKRKEKSQIHVDPINGINEWLFRTTRAYMKVAQSVVETVVMTV